MNGVYFCPISIFRSLSENNNNIYNTISLAMRLKPGKWKDIIILYRSVLCWKWCSVLYTLDAICSKGSAPWTDHYISSRVVYHFLVSPAAKAVNIQVNLDSSMHADSANPEHLSSYYFFQSNR